jgi:uncharacterized RDD family membrane protein YckC
MNRKEAQSYQTTSMALVTRRTGAFLVDILLIFAVAGPCGFIIQLLINQPPKTGPGIWINILWNFSLPSWFYFLLCDRSRTGRTVGKRILKLQVVRQMGKRLGWGQALGRTAVKLLPWEIIHFSAFALSKDHG